MKKVISYIKDSYNELVYKVSWPTRSELSSSAVVVMFASSIAYNGYNAGFSAKILCSQSY